MLFTVSQIRVKIKQKKIYSVLLFEQWPLFDQSKYIKRDVIPMNCACLVVFRIQHVLQKVGLSAAEDVQELFRFSF